MAVTGFKMDNDEGTFTCYGNVKNNIDHARDRAVDGCYQKSIDRHKKEGTMPKMLWSHNPRELPVGKWMEMREDVKGLFLKGKLSDTVNGRDIGVLAKDGALDSFSIGYSIPEGGIKRNTTLNCDDLLEIDVKEISWVTFACNEESRIVDEIKSRLHAGETPSKADLREMLKTIPGLSKREIERITAGYVPVEELDIKGLDELFANSELFH